ncbi:MAG TPA: hypothetical protein VI389_07115 [Geobacteraceae bacterium]
MEGLSRKLHRLGVNRAIGFGVLTRVWGLAAGPVTILFVASRLSQVEQGFYYTFSSLLALQVFFELGLMFVIAQFASHEFVGLRWGEGGRVEGDPVNLGRFTSLLGKSVTWFFVAATLLVAVLIPCGLAFLGQGHEGGVGFAWRLPWMVAVAGTAANLLAVPFMAVIMGSGDVASVNQRECLGAVAGNCACWAIFLLQGGLYAACAVSWGNAVVSWGYLLRKKPDLLRRGLGKRGSGSDGIGWWREVWPMQWKIALSWVSGYFIFQLFTPVLFRYQGPVVAGQMGITLTASNALFAAAIAWLSTKSPDFGKLVAVRDWRQLDQLFFRVLGQATTFAAVGAAAGWALIKGLQTWHPLGQRFIPAGQVAILLAAVCINVVISGLAIYLRAHKREPFLVVSLIGALLQGTATWYLGKNYGSFGIVAGFLAVTMLFGLPAAVFVWRRCRAAWHGSTSSPVDSSEKGCIHGL